MDCPVAATRAYELEFDQGDWEELQALSFHPFEFESGEALTRGQWLALGEMCLGKAQRVESGAYGDSDEAEGVDCGEWAGQLRTIADQIFDHFRAGDGRL